MTSFSSALSPDPHSPVTRRKGDATAPHDHFPLWLAFAAVLVRLLFLAVTRVTVEDSLISLRYAENLASGLGLVYNPGERVFGASTPLYVLFLAGLTKLGLPALLVSKTLAAAADGVTLFLWARWLRERTGSRIPALLFALFFGLSPITVHISVSGMETSFALLLLSASLLSHLYDRPLASGFFLGLLMLVRPDGAIAAVVILGHRWHQSRKVPWGPTLLAAAIVLPWVVVATWYYGSPVPHSIPAKAAAYNLHRPSPLPNLVDTLSHLVPIRGPLGRFLCNIVLALCWIPGLGAVLRVPRERAIGLLFVAWWAYLVLPKTLLFTWYLPPLMLPVYVLAGLGSAWWLERRPQVAPVSRWILAVLGLCAAGWLIWLGAQVRSIQQSEETVRKAIGLWLRHNTPEDTRVAMEPIGYIGYYSRRRVLDEVGLVSPEMVPLNRDGRGWFGRMVTDFQPDYIVERPAYLLRNRTLNSNVPMFRSPEEPSDFVARYEAVIAFESETVPSRLLKDYRFVIYRHRELEELREWREMWQRLSPAQREALLLRAVNGPVEWRPQLAAATLPPR